ncbi:putative reverse transcriptase domain-containing protein [Tanacetum coccineum]
MWCGDRLCVLDDTEIREALLSEVHSSPVSVHPGSTKMYRNLKQNFWWSGMKKYFVEFVEKCLTCQQVKIKHQRANELLQLQQLEIPDWKWDNITMDLVTELPKTMRKNEAIWVVVDRLTKSAHFLAIREGYSSMRGDGVRIYPDEGLQRDGVIETEDGGWISRLKKPYEDSA